MKRILITFIALVAMATGAWAATDYGFKLMKRSITSENYERYKEDGYDYDPINNVLHITKTNGYYVTVEGDVNPNLNISIDADIKETSNGDYYLPHLHKWLRFNGSGHHVISGTGSLHLTTFTQGDFLSETNNPIYVGTSHVTIKDIDIYINAVNGYGFYVEDGGSITFNHCNVKLLTGEGYAIYSETGCSLSLKYSQLLEGTIREGSQIIDSDGYLVHNTEIVKTAPRIPVDVFNVTVQKPVIGQTVGNVTAEVDCPQYCSAEVKWRKINSSTSYTPLNNSDVFEAGYAYTASVTLIANSQYVFSEDNDFDVFINGNKQYFSWSSSEVPLLYAFPELNTTYVLKVGYNIVKTTNQNDVLNDGGTVKYDPDTNTLYLNNANIINTEYNTSSTISGYGIYNDIEGLTINLVGSNTITSTQWVGLLSTKDLTITGAGTLNILAENGIALSMGRFGYNLKIKGGAKVNAKGMYGVIGGINTAPVGNGEVTESYVTTLSIFSEDTELRAYGTSQCVKEIAFLGDGIEYICEDNESLKLYFKNYSICSYDSRPRKYVPVANQWISLFNPNGITTDINQVTSHKSQITSDEWFDLSGRKLNGMPNAKGVYIHNGKTVIR